MRGDLLMIHPEDRGGETVRSAPNQTDARTGMPDPNVPQGRRRRRVGPRP